MVEDKEVGIDVLASKPETRSLKNTLTVVVPPEVAAVAVGTVASNVKSNVFAKLTLPATSVSLMPRDLAPSPLKVTVDPLPALHVTPLSEL